MNCYLLQVINLIFHRFEQAAKMKKEKQKKADGCNSGGDGGNKSNLLICCVFDDAILKQRFPINR